MSQRDLRGFAASSVARVSKQEFALPWAKLCAAYPRTKISEATATVYYRHLCRFAVHDLDLAVDMLIERCEFFPSVAHFIETLRLIPRPSPKLIDEPRASEEEVERGLEMLRALTKKMNVRDL